jgi:hypothetical protein
MKLEVKENMYVRTKEGYISQYKYYDTANMGKLLCIPLSNGTFANIEDVVKASYNIIDILEKGDYVNGLPIVCIYEDTETNEKYLDLYGCISEWGEEDIVSVVTEEQFEYMGYSVGR